MSGLSVALLSTIIDAILVFKMEYEPIVTDAPDLILKVTPGRDNQVINKSVSAVNLNRLTAGSCR